LLRTSLNSFGTNLAVLARVLHEVKINLGGTDMSDAMGSTSAISDAAAKVQSSAIELKDAVVEHGSEAVKRACDATEETIKTNPYSSVLVAFGVGALLGVLLFRR
jgi:ElaB/YqjD/DUF883 family membrane-anchored ribosome-binding protein